VKGQEKVQWGLGNPDEGEVVKTIYLERLRGTAYVIIAERLNARKIPCPQRGRWRNKDQKWSGITVKTILENPAYYGARAYNRNSMSKILAHSNGREINQRVSYPHWRNDPSEWVLEEGAHTAIIEKDVWQSVQSVNREHKLTKKNQHIVRGEYLLSGLLRCS
jgi:site-specific DNA recombinase